MFTLRRPKVEPDVLVGRLLVLAVLVLAVGAWLLLAHTLATARRVPHVDVPQPNAVVWNKRVYQSWSRLASDLRRRGATPQVWARDHPGAAALLDRLETTARHR